jgi:hypothetical protein
MIVPEAPLPVASGAFAQWTTTYPNRQVHQNAAIAMRVAECYAAGAGRDADIHRGV